MGLITADLNLDNYIWLMKKTNNKHNMIGGEYYPLFFSVVHNVSIEDNWKQYNNFMTYNDYKDSIVMLLNVIPECGSYFMQDKGIKSDDYWLYARVPGHANKRGDFCDIVKTTIIRPNMDYMILFNLYYLLLEDNLPLDEDWANHEYPTTQFSPEGSHDNPASFIGVKFTMNKAIHSDGNLTLTASHEIELLPGFETEEGAEFVAQINKGVFTPDCDLNFPNGTNPCPPEKSIDSSEIVVEEPIYTKNEKNNESFYTDTIENYIYYPNPVVSELNILFNNNFVAEDIKIIDFSGRFVKSIEPAPSHVKADISNLSDGLYFLIIKTNNQTEVSEFITS